MNIILEVCMLAQPPEYLGGIDVGAYCCLNESGLRFFDKLCPVGFPLVCKCSKVLL